MNIDLIGPRFTEALKTNPQLQEAFDFVQKQHKNPLTILQFLVVYLAERQKEKNLFPLEHQYWVLQIMNWGTPILRGPFSDVKMQTSEYDMCLLDPGTQHILLIDPPNQAIGETKPNCYAPSQAYRKERQDYIDNLPDE